MLTRLLGQTLTYWAPSGGTDFFGKPALSAAATLKGRWEDRTDSITTQTAEEYKSKARIFVAASVAVGGWLYLGSSSASDPRTVNGAREIVKVESIPARIPSSETLYTAWL